jgi:hypothetical protein
MAPLCSCSCPAGTTQATFSMDSLEIIPKEKLYKLLILLKRRLCLKNSLFPLGLAVYNVPVIAPGDRVGYHSE